MLGITSLKPSIVLQAMVTGLRKAKDDPDFEIRMSTFGEVEKNICYGCAATVTLAEMFGGGKSVSEMMLSYASTKPKLDPSEDFGFVWAKFSSVLPLEPSIAQDSLPDYLPNLERAVDRARTGDVSFLIRFLTGDFDEFFDRRWKLRTDNWEEQLPDVEKTIVEMATAGY